MGKLWILLLLAVVTLATAGACAKATQVTTTPTPAASVPSMAGERGMATGPVSPPPVKGYYAGQEIWFIHTEASDAKVAQMLTAMMSSPVLVVPRLAQVPASSLSDVFVFTNGVPGGGPFGFQPDVFDSAPGDERYSPLRAVKLVAWKEGVPPRVLRSAAEVRAASSAGEVAITDSGAVVNMPMLTWPGGRR